MANEMAEGMVDEAAVPVDEGVKDELDGAAVEIQRGIDREVMSWREQPRSSMHLAHDNLQLQRWKTTASTIYPSAQDVNGVYKDERSESNVDVPGQDVWTTTCPSSVLITSS